MKRTLAPLILLLLFFPVSADAQRLDVRGFEVYGGYASWAGGDVESVDPGFQIGFMALGETAPHVGFGTELVLGFFEQFGVAVDEIGVNLVFRYALGPREGFHGFAQGRAGWSRLAASGVTQDGLVIGPEAGIELPFSDQFRVILAAGATWRSYENVNLGVGIPLSDTHGTGWQWGGRVGIAVGEIF